MHDQIYEFISNLETAYPSRQLKETHLEGQPVPLTIIDNFLPAHIFDSIVSDIDNIPKNSYTTFSYDVSFRQECRDFTKSPMLQSLVNSFNSSKFLYWIEGITGLEKLIPDPHLRGGGLARISSGNRLGLHTDFNWNDQLRINRKVNLILYLTPNWQSEWNGNLELWNKDTTQCITKIEPVGNRLIIWNYESWLVHGNSQTLFTPAGITRDNLIHFYYTSNATWEEDPRRSKFL
jgi:hypothetical protein